jgi:hypothetical protein
MMELFASGATGACAALALAIAFVLSLIILAIARPPSSSPGSREARRGGPGMMSRLILGAAVLVCLAAIGTAEAASTSCTPAAGASVRNALVIACTAASVVIVLACVGALAWAFGRRPAPDPMARPYGDVAAPPAWERNP